MQDGARVVHKSFKGRDVPTLPADRIQWYKVRRDGLIKELRWIEQLLKEQGALNRPVLLERRQK